MKPFKNYILTLLLLLVFANGNAQILYARAFGTAGGDVAYDIIVAHDSNYVMLGRHYQNIYLAKADTIGQLIWEKSYFIQSINTQPNSICEIGDTSFVIGGIIDNKGYLLKVNAIGDSLYSNTDTTIVGNNVSNLRVAPDGNLLALVTRNGIVDLVKFDNNLNVIARIDSLTPPSLRGIEVINNTIYILKKDSISNLLMMNNDFSQIDTVIIPIKYPIYLKKSFDNSTLIVEGVDTNYAFAPRKLLNIDLLGNVITICDSTFSSFDYFVPIDNNNDFIYNGYYYSSTWGQDFRLYFTDNCGQVLHDTILYRGGSMGDPWRDEFMVKILVDQNGNYVLFGRAEKGPLGDWDILFWIYKKWDGFPIGIDDIENDKLIIDNAITIYPNPTQDQFTVSGITENSSITVLDVMGKVVYFAQNTKHQIPITTTNWAKGLYIVQLKGNKSSTTLKVIKQ